MVVCTLIQTRAYATTATQALISAHDHVANKEFPEQFLNDDADETKTVRVVRLQKDDKPLGATIKANKTGYIVIARVLHGSVADKSGEKKDDCSWLM